MIDKIYHLADIHVRNLQRHKEYRLIFKKFLKQVKQDNIKNSVIYLGGDIAHAKTEMSPELVREISWFLNECAKLRDTFVITGNHDCNLNNNYRLDVLTPIIENLNNPKIHYLRDTGVYKHENLTFVVYSIMDDKKNWPSGYDVEGENVICLFHGPVNKAQTDIGYTVSSNSFTTEMFNGFDMALFGDIHKRQILQEFSETIITIDENELEEYQNKGWYPISEPKNGKIEILMKKPVVSYCGSMVQQNHGEMLENHGYLIWDVKTKTYTEHHIHNDYGYLTIDVVDGVIPQWVYDEIGVKLPKYPRLRLRFTNTQAAQMKLCITELKKLFKTPEITVTRTDTIGQLNTGQRLNKNIVGEVNDITFQNQLIRDYLERRFLLESDELEEITEINKDIHSRIDDKNLAENIMWNPVTFEFSNMFSYGEANKVNFEKAQGLIGIFAPNTSGKSSLWDALSFCIYDKSARTNSSKNILNNRKDHFYCKFNFEINGVQYFIERKAKWTRNKTNLKVDVNFWKEDAGVIESLNGEQRRETNKNIERYLGKFEDFVLTTLSLQGNNALFIDKSQSERKEILSQFIGVDIFDKLYQVAADENRDNATLIRKFKSDDFTTKLATLSEDYKLSKLKYDSKKIELDSETETVEQINKKLITLNSKMVKLNSDLIGIDEFQKRKSLLETKLNQIDVKKENSEKRIDKLETLQLQLEELLDKFDEEKLIEDVNTLNQLNKRNATVNNEIEKINIKWDALIAQKKHLDVHEYNPDCEICIKNSESIIQSKKQLEKKIDILDKELNTYKIEKSELEHKITNLKQSKTDFDTFQDAQQKENKVDRELSTEVNNISVIETEELKLQTQLDNQIKLIDEYYTNEEQIKKNKKIRDEIVGWRYKLTTSKNNVKNLSKDVLDLNGHVSSVGSQMKTIQDRIQEVKNLEKQTKLYDYYLNALSKDGVSYELIEKALPMIEGEVNNILAQIVEFGIQFDIDGRNINSYLVYGDQKWSLEMCSGMERFISSIAIRVALINVCNLPRPNFLVIDEGFGSLDSEHMQSLYMLFTYLKTQFDFVMIISHLDTLRDVVDNLIEIKKVNGFSHIKF
jgi:DNA repair exonuclease SbcCD ATPase subunit